MSAEHAVAVSDRVLYAVSVTAVPRRPCDHAVRNGIYRRSVCTACKAQIQAVMEFSSVYGSSVYDSFSVYGSFSVSEFPSVSDVSSVSEFSSVSDVSSV